MRVDRFEEAEENIMRCAELILSHSEFADETVFSMPYYQFYRWLRICEQRAQEAIARAEKAKQKQK